MQKYLEGSISQSHLSKERTRALYFTKDMTGEKSFFVQRRNLEKFFAPKRFGAAV